MPAVPDSYVDSVIYLYGSPEEAKRCDPVGGCGVLTGVGYQEIPNLCHVYVVSHKHVTGEPEQCRVVTYNTREGVQRRDLTGARWYDHREGWDLSV